MRNKIRSSQRKSEDDAKDPAMVPFIDGIKQDDADVATSCYEMPVTRPWKA